MRLYVIFDYKEVHPELAGRDLTDALIRDCLGVSSITVRRTEKGKPYIAGPRISVSHSEGTFALLVSDAEAGLDIQYARDVRMESIAARLFTEEEAAYSSEDPAGDRFFQLWTRKEAYSKYTGEGMEQIMRREPVLAREDVEFRDIRLKDGCYCSICLARINEEGGCEPDEVQISYGE